MEVKILLFLAALILCFALGFPWFMFLMFKYITWVSSFFKDSLK